MLRRIIAAKHIQNLAKINVCTFSSRSKDNIKPPKILITGVYLYLKILDGLIAFHVIYNIFLYNLCNVWSTHTIKYFVKI